MKVLYDHQIFSGEKFGGVSRYFYELMINSNGYYDYQVSGLFSENEYVENLDIFKPFPIKKYFKGKIRLVTLLNKRDSVRKIKRNPDCILHPTYYDPYFLNNKGQPVVLTVYDMIHERFPHYFMNDKSIFQYKKQSIMGADKIIAISESTKRDLLHFYPEVSEDKINVIYLGSSAKPFKEVNNSYGSYILFTGKRDKYKNFNSFAEAVAPLLIQYDLNLVCTGNNFTPEEIGFFESLGIRNRVYSKFVNDVELALLYSNAILFAFPSLYEGFGIPILEAFTNHCPLVLSDTSSFPEIAGDAGVYFDPNSINDIRKKIDDVIGSQSLRNELVLKGNERLKLFNWKKCAESTADVYHTLI